MPYTRITPSRNGREAIDYALGGVDAKGHNGNEARNLLVGSVNMLPPEVMGYADQMDMYWRKASVRNITQVRRIITSYSKDELPPDDPHSPEIALTIAQEHAKEAYPGRQVLICVQGDGVGGCIHVHEIVNNVSMVNGKGCTTEQTKFSYVAKTVDDVAKKYVALSMDFKDKYDEKTHKIKNPKDKVTQNERRMRNANENTGTEGEGPLHYIWKDDLKARVLAAMAEASSRDDYLKRLTAHGVEGEYRFSKKKGDYIIYELTDITGFGMNKVPPNLKSKSYKMGEDYDLNALDAAIQKQAETAAPTYEPPKITMESLSLPELTPEKKEELEEAGRYQKWRDENGYSWYDENGKLSIRLMDEAKKAYESYKAALAQAAHDPPETIQEQRMEQEKPPTEPEKPAYEAIEPRYRGTRAAEEESQAPKEQESTKAAEHPEPVTQPVRTALMQKLIRDRDEADKKWAAKEQEEQRLP